MTALLLLLSILIAIAFGLTGHTVGAVYWSIIALFLLIKCLKPITQ